MNKYFIRKNSNSNEVGLISLSENQLQEVEHWLYNNENFVKPIIENDTIIEGATPEEIAELKKSDLTNRITSSFTILCKRALASSIGKPLSSGYDYIKEQADRYKYKYAVVKGNIVDAFLSQMIANEALDFGITEEDMKVLIIQKYEQGESTYLSFTATVERARTKALTAIENNDNEKAKQIVLLMESVPEILTMQDAENLTNQMLLL
jgi:hypothetical protein